MARLLLLSTVLLACADAPLRTGARQAVNRWYRPGPGNYKGSGESGLWSRALGWRGWFAIHTWIFAQATGVASYTVYEAIGWHLRSDLPVVRIEKDLPDRYLPQAAEYLPR